MLKFLNILQFYFFSYIIILGEGGSMLKIAICDDEISIRKELKALTKAFLNRNDFIYEIYEFDDGDKLLLSNIKFSIIFLDIDMKFVDGLSAAKKIRFKDKMTKIIFVTNHPEFIKQALLVRAFGYLDKPIQRDEFEITFTEALEYYQDSTSCNFMTFHTIKGDVLLDINKIIYFEYIDRKIKIITETHELYMYSTIKKITDELSSHDFSCPHKAYLVNLAYVHNIIKRDVVLTNFVKLPLSQKKATQFKNDLSSYINKMHVRRLK